MMPVMAVRKRRRRTVRVTITIPNEQLQAVDKLAQELLLARSAVVRLAISEYLKRDKRLGG